MKLLYKDCKLSASPLSYWFLAAALLTFVPGYPILVGAFFVTLGIFYSFQTMRENNDILYSLLLPVAKAEVVKSKFAFAVTIELCGFVPMTAITLIRMLWLTSAAVYTENALMCANLGFLGFVLLIFGLFNRVFIGGFFKTAYAFGKPFVVYIVLSFAVIVAAETLPHLPGGENFNAFGFSPLWPQALVLLVGGLAFLWLTAAGVRRSVSRFETIDIV